MQLNKELDYDTIYNGRGIEIGNILIDYLGEDMKLIKKEFILPDRPDRNNKVGVRLTFRLKDRIKIVCVVNNYVSFFIDNIGIRKKSIDDMDYMTFAKMEKLGFSLSDEVVYKKLMMLKYTLDAVRNGDEIIKFDVEKEY